MATICGHDRATGQGAETGVEAMNNIVVNDQQTPVGTTNVEDLSSNMPSMASEGSVSKRKRRRVNDTLADAVKQMAETLAKACAEDSHHESAEKIYAELSQIPDLERSELLQAYTVLTSDARKFESFMALPPDIRKDWILMEIKK